MDNVILPIPHDPVQSFALAKKMSAFRRWNADAFSTKRFNFILVEWVFHRCGKIKLKPGLIRIAEKMHELVFDSPDVHCTSEN